ncbi:calcium:proton antiporter [Roseospira marina]|uniref:Calcium:proton antiporter n=1 Tax=Roseospira marina TaxID=140057 RepID=A0A5M6IF41_9PROT|nr:cache domain-containing protein [Roseospira marina]KAA5606853.1 calcium:proton antiporter [Roseospira marina]MBB4312980.1 signal transduction histidine kinase [Roseospira marina]MBB5086247.1 signal transduction histidine kinase [Roseospira marina]
MPNTLRGLVAATALALAVPAATTATAAEGASATADEVIAKVQEAARFLHDKGQAGFSDFNNNADWVWKDSYVFVFSCLDDRMIAHPLRPDMVGRPILQMEDEQGNRLFQDLCAAGEAPEGGWVEYWWPRPGEAKASRKISYTISTEVSFQPDVRVGAGIYDETMSMEDLDELAAQALRSNKDAP